jgi:anti-sigma-K factor RskA
MKTLLGLILILTISNCSSYKVVVDSAGRSGTFQHAKAEQITDDTILCTKFAENTLSDSQEFQAWIIDNVLRPASLGVVSKADDTRKNYIRKCMTNRGHSVLN